jgi:hypothetical protein
VAVRLGDLECDAVCVWLQLDDSLGVPVALADIDGVTTWEAVPVALGVPDPLGVVMPLGVCVPLCVRLCEGVGVAVDEPLGVPVGLGDPVLVDDMDCEGVAVELPVWEYVRVIACVRVDVTDAVWLCEGVLDLLGDAVMLGVAVWLAVNSCDAVPDPLCV